MPLTPITVIYGINGQWNPDGTAATGRITLQPVQETPDPGYTIVASPRTFTLSAGQIASPNTFDTNGQPGLQALVYEQVDGAKNPQPYVVAIPTSGTLDLSIAARTPAAGPPAPLYVPESAVGAANGVASLGSDGILTASQRPSAPVTSVNTHTGAVVLTAADVGALTQATADGRYDALGAAASEATRAQAAEALKLAKASNLSDLASTATARANLGAQASYTSTAVQAANYTAMVWQLVPCDATAGSFTVTLPTGASTGAQVAVKLLATTGSNTVTVAAGGTDVINQTGTTSVVLQLVGESFELTSTGSGVWILASGQKTLTSLDGRYVAKGALIYNARDHGIVADWTSIGTPGTNNQPVLASLVSTLGALYASTGLPQVIYFPPGDYSFRDNGTVWTSGVSVIGAGPGATRFHLANPLNPTNPTPFASYVATFNGASTSSPLTDCTFAHLEVDGSGVSLASYSTGAKAFVLQYMVRARFYDLYLHDCGATALGCDFLQDSIIDGVVAINNGRLNNGSQPGGAGIGVGIGGWGTVERTTIVNCTTKGNGTHGIFVESQNGTTPRGVRIVGCHAEGNVHGISDWGADGLIVSGCTMIGNSKDGFNVSGSGVAATAGRGGLVTNCTIDGNTLDGVLVGDTPGKYTIRGNRISNNGQHGVHLASTTQTSSFAVTEFATTENDIYLNAQAGVRTDCVMTDGFVLNNRIRNNGSNNTVTADLRSGISLNAAANTPTIVGNRAWDNQGSKTQQYGLYITSTGTIGAGTVQNNNFNGNAAGGWAGTGAISGGLWTQNAGLTVGVTSGAQTTIIDGNEYVNGQLRYLAFTRKWNSGTLTASATANTNGTAQTLSPSSLQLGFSAITLTRAVFAGTFGAETATCTWTATFSDNSTASATVAATTTGAVVLGSSGLLSLAKDSCYVKTISVALQSTIANSQATCSVDVIAAQN